MSREVIKPATVEELEVQASMAVKYGSYSRLFYTAKKHHQRIVPGLSIGLATPVRGTGSLGVILDIEGLPHGTTAAHVMPDSRWSKRVTQPGTADFGLMTNQDRDELEIGEWKRSFHYWALESNIDFATFEITKPHSRNQVYRYQEPVSAEPLEPEEGMKVVKVGRTTGLTFGVVEGKYDVDIQYPSYMGGTQTVRGVWKVKPRKEGRRDPEWSLGGDSGAAVWTMKDGKWWWAGTHIAGNRERGGLTVAEREEQEQGWMHSALDCMNACGANSVWGGTL